MIWTRLFRAGGVCAPMARPRQRTAVLRIEVLEDRSVPAFTFTPNAFGGGNFNPFPNFTGPVETASTDVNGDGVPDIITAQGPGVGSTSEVRIFDGASARNGQAILIADFYPYGNTAGPSPTPGFAGGVFVAGADLNGDKFGELITTTGAGGRGHMKVFDFHDPTTGQFLGSNPILRTSAILYSGYSGDVRVAAVNRGTGLAPLVVTASGGGSTSSDVRVFDNAFSIGGIVPGAPVAAAAQMFAFPGYAGGVSIAPGGTTGNPLLYLAPTTGSPLVSAFNLNTSPLGGVTFSPNLTFPTGTGPQTTNFLTSSDVNGTGTLDVLASSVGPTGTTPVSAYSIAGGAASPVALPAGFQGFQGFGFFGNSWLASSAFTAPPQAAPVGTGLPGSTTVPGTTGFGTTPTPGTIGTNNGGTNSGTGFGTGNGTTSGTGSGTGAPSTTFPNAPASSTGTLPSTTSTNGTGSSGTSSTGM